jgi:hypothetical protein
MPQPSFEDITPPRRSIRDIPLPEKKDSDNKKQQHMPAEVKHHSHQEKEQVDKVVEENDDNGRTIDLHQRPNSFNDDVDDRKSPRWLIWSVCVVAIVALLFVSSMFFAGADVTVTPKTEIITVSLMATSTTNGSGGTLPYDTIVLNREEGINASSAAAVAEANSSSSQPAPKPSAPTPAAKASGTITIYNNYSSASQELIATTRFETASGLVYRIDKDVTVPGMSTVNGASVPGSIAVTVFADQTGSNYNIGPTTFTIPGFQGTAKYNSFSAKSTISMTGGSSGKSGGSTQVQSNSPDDQFRSVLESQIQNDLIMEAKAQLPDNYVLFPSSSRFIFGPASSTEDYISGSSSSDDDIREQGTAYFVIFDRDQLTGFLQTQLMASSSANAAITNINGLDISLGDSSTSDISQNNPLTLTLSGTTTVEWNVDSGKLADDLQGKSKSSLSTVLKQYPEISSAEAFIKPFWKTNFPSDANNIKVIVNK